MSGFPRPVVLVVLDGFGVGDGGFDDATHAAATPGFFDRARREYPHAELATSGSAVGLPEGQMGNSEVGHMTMGAGRIIQQDMTRIDSAIARGELAANPALAGALEAVAASGGKLHLMGLLSDGGVHSHQEHLYALLELAAQAGVPAVVHAFLDGRDTPPQSGLGYVEALLPHLAATGSCVATIMGRYYAMDRDQRYDRIARAYRAIVCRDGVVAPDPVAAVRDAYDRKETDEFVAPTWIEGTPGLEDGDAVIFFNFRADRARQLTSAIADVCPERFEGALERERVVSLARFVCFTEYDAEFGLPVAFAPFEPTGTLGQWLAEHGIPQLRIAETEKYAHVTFFFNCGLETALPGEDRALIPSPREVATYDQKPQMSAERVTEELIERIASGRYGFILVNYANPDMVGHTGVLPAAVRAVETVDACLARVSRAVLEAGGTLLVTADHGNCERMVDPATGGPHTAHTTNPVPIWWVTNDPAGRTLRSGGLADLAPTLLELLGLPVPEVMTGRSLLAAA